MAVFSFRPQLALDVNGNLSPGGVGQVYALDDTTYTSPLPATDETGAPLAAVAVTSGRSQLFRVEGHGAVMWKSGSLPAVELISADGFLAVAQASQLAAENAAAAAQDLADLATGTYDSQLAGILATPGGAARAEVAAIASAAGGGGFVSAADNGVVGDGVTDDTAALSALFASGASLGLHVLVPMGFTCRITSHLTVPSGSTITVAGTLDLSEVPVSGEGAVRVTGSEDAPASLTSNAAAGATTLAVGTGHGIEPGDLVRVASDELFDSHNTDIKLGELAEVVQTTTSSITLAAPLCSTYTTATNARVSKISPARHVRIYGPGKLVGRWNDTAGESGLVVRAAVDVLIDGLTSEGFDTRHVALIDCVNARVRDCRITWAGRAGYGYGITTVNASQDCVIEHNRIDRCRHAFSTTNEAAVPGITRRILVARNTVPSTLTASGDALDTHGAAEDIWFDFNTVLSAAGQGINHECRSGRIVGNLVMRTANHGIAVHNESDAQGEMRVEGNTVQHAAGVGIYIFPAARGATSFYEQLTVSGNKVRDTSGVGLSVGLQAVNARDWNVTVTSNEILRAGDVGLSVQNADGGSVASNTVWDCVQGIVVDDCVHVAVTGNSSRTGATSSATYVGIDVKGASQWVTVAANTVRALSASQIGIRFADTASICWVGPNAVRSPTPLVEGANASSIYVTTAA